MTDFRQAAFFVIFRKQLATFAVVRKVIFQIGKEDNKFSFNNKCCNLKEKGQIFYFTLFFKYIYYLFCVSAMRAHTGKHTFTYCSVSFVSVLLTDDFTTSGKFCFMANIYEEMK